MKPAAVIDLVREHRAAYLAKPQPAVVDVGGGVFLTAEGRGDPSGSAFQAAVGGLYAAAYTMKFGRRGSRLRPFKVAPLEGLWWGRAPVGDFSAEPRESWNWKILIRLPDDASRAELKQAVATLRAKGRADGAKGVRLERFREGRCVQALHVGPYATERATIDRMLAFAHEQGMAFSGRHHEVYLSDPRRVAPEKMKTVLRVAVKRLSAKARPATA